MSKEIIAIGDSVHEIEVKPITLIFKGPNVPDVEYAGRFPMGMDVCLYHMDRVQVFHAETERLMKVVFKDYKGSLSPDGVRKMGLGFKHVGGRIDLSLKLKDKNIPFAWIYPESGLHPSACTELADVVIELTK